MEKFPLQIQTALFSKSKLLITAIVISWRKQNTEELEINAVWDVEIMHNLFFAAQNLHSTRNKFFNPLFYFPKFRMHCSFIAEAASLVRQIQTWKSTFWKHPDKWYVTMAFWMPSHLLSFVLLRCKADAQSNGPSWSPDNKVKVQSQQDVIFHK